MITRHLLDQVEILNRQITGDQRGDRAFTWPADATPEPALWQPAAGGEVARPDGTTITGDGTLFLQPSSTIDGYARVKLNALRYEVIGEPARFPHGQLAHIEAVLKVVL